MPAQGRMQLICSALLGALVISCAAPPIYVVAPPAPRAEQEQRGGQQAEQPPVEEQVPAEQQPAERPPVVVLQPPVVAQPGPASQGGGGVAQVPNPGSQPRQPTGGQQRPSGNAPGVRHDIPKIGNSDLSESDGWTQGMQDACTNVGLRDSDCPTFDIQVFTKDNGKETHINNPGPNYGTPPFSSCPVKSIDPRPPQQGGPKLVSAGTVIKVTVVCIPVESNAGTKDPQGNVVQPDKADLQGGSTDTSNHQLSTDKSKITKQGGSGQADTSQQHSGKKQGKTGTQNGSGG
jgi:hypothetical protein